MCELAKHIYDHRDEVKSKPPTQAEDKWKRISMIDVLMDARREKVAE